VDRRGRMEETREKTRGVAAHWRRGGWVNGGSKEYGRGNAKPRCRRFGFGKSAFVGNRARSAREGRDQWP